MAHISVLHEYVIVICLVGTLSFSNSQSSYGTGRQIQKTLINYGECLTPLKERAICIKLGDCDVLYTMAKKFPLRDPEKIFLQKSQCGYTNNTVLVCCPETLAEKTTNFGTRSGGLLPRPGICGYSVTDRIAGANVTKLDDFPWMALLIYKDRYNSYSYLCGGSLITNRYVLTAAHCILVNNVELVKVRLGEWDVLTNPDCVIDVSGHKDCADPHVEVTIERAITHKEYVRTSSNQFNDIGLLRLSRYVEFTDFIRPICLPLADNLKGDFVGHKMDIAGWGRTETGVKSTIKLTAAIPIVSMSDCQDKYLRIRNPRLLQSTQICAGGEIGIDSCKGDSGGPLIGFATSNDQSYNFIAGIISYGAVDCQFDDLPGVHTRVSEYVDWILQQIDP